LHSSAVKLRLFVVAPPGYQDPAGAAREKGVTAMVEPRERCGSSFSFVRKPRRDAAGRPESPRPEDAPPGGRGDAAGEPSPAPADGSERAAGERGGLRQWVGADRATLAIAFTDIVSSTAVGNKLGDGGMSEIRRAHFARAEQLARRYGGRIVKTMGDSVMAAFRSAVEATDFALALHEDTGDRRIRIRAGIHVGPVRIEADDAQGTTVSYAARVASMPRGAEVWLSSEAMNHVRQELGSRQDRLRVRVHAGLELKGFAGRHILWSVGRA
ncbi:MAG: adenylate/guanylate cyclase domain-containing protein, partial [Planctomycetes bacterium]|nr:adenylate/guanylate cyclase domain-containing protein [Planctomycetota bacterium]